jgi:hypothetical protein
MDWARATGTTSKSRIMVGRRVYFSDKIIYFGWNLGTGCFINYLRKK